MKKLFLLAALVITLSFTGCFQILHYLNLNSDGSIDVLWQFDMSRQLAEMNNKKGGGAHAPDKKKGVVDKLAKTRAKILKKLEGKVENLKLKEIKNDFTMGMVISFTAKKFIDLSEKGEEFAIFPKYDKKKKTLTFTFNPKKKKGVKEKKSKDKKKEEKKIKDKGKTTPPAQPKKMDMGMGKIMSAVMSSARYEIILGGRFNPARVAILGKSGKTYPVSLLKIGSEHLINIPFVSISMKEKKGFDLVVYMKNSAGGK